MNGHEKNHVIKLTERGWFCIECTARNEQPEPEVTREAWQEVSEAIRRTQQFIGFGADKLRLMKENDALEADRRAAVERTVQLKEAITSALELLDNVVSGPPYGNVRRAREILLKVLVSYAPR